MRLLYACLVISISISSCAQGKYGIVKSHAYYRESSPGTIAVDDNGVQMQRVDTSYTVFFETNKTNVPVWEKAWVNGNTFKVLSTIMSTPFIVGMKNDVDEQVTLTADANNQLLQLNLERAEPQPVPSGYEKKAKVKGILLQGMQADKKVFLVIDKMEHLRGREYQ